MPIIFMPNFIHEKALGVQNMLLGPLFNRPEGECSLEPYYCVDKRTNAKVMKFFFP